MPEIGRPDQASLFLADVTSGASFTKIKNPGLPKLSQSKLKLCSGNKPQHANSSPLHTTPSSPTVP